MSDLQITPRARRHTPRRVKTDAGRWRDLMKLLGYHVRSLRDVLQLSQAELGHRAGVSQGAISRVESGRHLDTPLVTYARVAAAVCRELGPVRDKLTPGVRAVLSFAEHVLALEGIRSPLALFEDPTLESLIRVYRALPAADRTTYAAYVEQVGRLMLERR